MTNDKPLPDEVDLVINGLSANPCTPFDCRVIDVIKGQSAHIAAQDEKIKELKADADAWRLTCKMYVAVAEDKEAENKQLQDALFLCKSELVSIHMQHGDEAHAAEMSAGIRMAQAALAPARKEGE